jgi:tetratricopeptide (TPR) repeat protein
MYYQRGEFDLARQYLSKAAAGDPTQAAAFFYLGLTDLKLNRMEEAEANVRCAIALAPMTPNYHFALGIVLKVKGNSAGALAEFSKELELNPAHQAAAQQVTEIQRQVVSK